VARKSAVRRAHACSLNWRESSLAKGVAIGTFPTESEQVLHLYDEDPPIWYRDRPPVHERSHLVITKKMAPRRVKARTKIDRPSFFLSKKTVFLIFRRKTMYIVNTEPRLLYTFRIISQYCFAQTIRHLHQDFSSISVRFLLASESTGAERMAVRFTPRQFKGLQAR
jgi:hypothetical protein